MSESGQGYANPLPLVLLPGMMCDAALWQPQINCLGAERPVSVVDFHNLDNVSRMAWAVLDVIDAVAPAGGPVALAGLSMGGIVSFEVMRLAPARIAALALLDTNHLAETDESRSIRERQIAEAKAGWLYWLLRDELKPAYRSLTREPPAAMLDTVMAMGLRHGPGSFIAQSRALLHRSDSSDTLRSIACPTLVLCGADDALCPVARHEAMASLIHNATFVAVPECGHLSTLEQPDPVNAELRRWLESINNATSSTATR